MSVWDEKPTCNHSGYTETRYYKKAEMNAWLEKVQDRHLQLIEENRKLRKKTEVYALLEDAKIETTNTLTQKLAEYMKKAEMYDELEKTFKIYTGELCWQQDRFIGVFKKLEAIRKICDLNYPRTPRWGGIRAQIIAILEDDLIDLKKERAEIKTALLTNFLMTEEQADKIIVAMEDYAKLYHSSTGSAKK